MKILLRADEHLSCVKTRAPIMNQELLRIFFFKWKLALKMDNN